jgi:hypothetical protein
MHITADHLDRRRRDAEQVSALARDIVTNRALVTANTHVIRNAFYMILAFLDFAPDAIPKIGALIGYYDNVVPTRAMNGYPIFTSLDFVHADDVPRLNAEIDRMQAALGITPKGKGESASVVAHQDPPTVE